MLLIESGKGHLAQNRSENFVGSFARWVALFPGSSYFHPENYIKQVVLVYLRSYKCLTMDVDKSNLSILESMGFLNEEANYNALRISNNNLESAIEILSNTNITENGC